MICFEIVVFSLYNHGIHFPQRLGNVPVHSLSVSTGSVIKYVDSQQAEDLIKRKSLEEPDGLQTAIENNTDLVPNVYEGSSNITTLITTMVCLIYNIHAVVTDKHQYNRTTFSQQFSWHKGMLYQQDPIPFTAGNQSGPLITVINLIKSHIEFLIKENQEHTFL